MHGSKITNMANDLPKQKENQTFFAVALSYILSFLPINNCLNSILSSLGIYTGIDTLLYYGLLWFFVGISIVKILLNDTIKKTSIIFNIFRSIEDG